MPIPNSLAILELVLVALVAFALEHFFIIRKYEPKAQRDAEAIVAEAHRIRENSQKEVETAQRQAAAEAKEASFQFREIGRAHV